MKFYSVLALTIFSSACGRPPKAEPQSPGSIVVPAFPMESQRWLGLNEVVVDREKAYTGQLLLWQSSAKPEAVAAVVNTLNATVPPLVAKYHFLRDEVEPLVDTYTSLSREFMETVVETDPSRELRNKRLEVARSWFDKKLADARLPEDAEAGEADDFSSISRDRFELYCDAKIWQRVFMAPHAGKVYHERPTPAAICEGYYQEQGYFADDSHCGQATAGKNYAACLWFDGVLKTKVFSHFWYGNDPATKQRLLAPSTFEKLKSMAEQSGSLTDVSAALLGGESIYNAEDGVEVLAALPLTQGLFSAFSYKKCRRYRPGCTPRISVQASKLRNVIDFVETDNQVLLFSAETRGTNGLGNFFSQPLGGVSVHESIFNEPLRITAAEGEQDFARFDDEATAVLGSEYPRTVFDSRTRRRLGELAQARVEARSEILKLAPLLAKERKLACATKRNFYCPIQNATNDTLKLAVQAEVSSGFFRSVNLKARRIDGKADAYVISFGLSEDRMHTACIGGDGSEECSSDGLLRVESYDAKTGQISLAVRGLTTAKLERLGLITGNERPIGVDLFEDENRVNKIDFFEADLSSLEGCDIIIDLVPYGVAGLFEKIYGEFRVTGRDAEIQWQGNLSLQETSATNPLDRMWNEFVEDQRN